MNNARIIISITLVALATTSFAQRSNTKDKLFHGKTEISSAVYPSETASYIQWTADLPSRLDHMNFGISASPLVVKTLFATQADVRYENESGLEGWMSVPFKFETDEEDLSIEPWMTKPFLSSGENEDLKLESWMATPFKCGTAAEKWVVADNSN